MKTQHISVIQQAQIDSLHLSPSVCMAWVREAFMMKDEAQMPAKLSVHPQGEDFVTTMPCLLPERNGRKYFGIKVVSRIEGQQPVLQSNIYLFDAKSGQQLAVVDGDWITAMRTGAVAAVAARTLERPGTDTYSLMGLGNIGRAVTACLIDSNRDRHITLRLLRYKDQAERLVERFADSPHVSFDIVDDARAFAAEADVLISCVTVATELLFPDDSLFRPGVTVIPVHVRGFQNCDLFFEAVFGDDTGQIQKFKYFNRFRHYAELSRVLQGQCPGRTSADERILSYNYGIALHDVFFAARIYEQAHDCAAFEMSKQDQRVWF